MTTARAGTKGEASRAEKARLVLELRQHYNSAVLLKVAGLSRSTFYDQAKALEAGDRHAGLKARIRQIYERHMGRYGYRRITAALRQAGETINHKAVQRLMQSLGLKSLVRPKKYRSYRGPSHVSVGSYAYSKFFLVVVCATLARQRFLTCFTVAAASMPGFVRQLEMGSLHALGDAAYPRSDLISRSE